MTTQNMSEDMDNLIDAIATSIVGCQGRTNRDRAKAVLAVIEEQGWRVERGKPLSDQVRKFLHGEL